VTGAEAKTAMEALIKMIKDKDPDVRKATAHALGQFGPAAKAALEPLTQAAEKEFVRDVREALNDALGRIRPAP
jgi:HEAT repeat protein